jgi:demethylmenaquinone methyltransferase / 2-methoxy-6-polyprenyl-1,4-benzoquinol methylase
MPPAPPRGNSAPPDGIRTMFDRIAPIYDAMNTVMTAGLDERWRRAAVTAARVQAGDRALDVACGTGRLTEALARAVRPGGEAVGVDVSQGMLRRAAGRAARAARSEGSDGIPAYREADALSLPFDDEGFDAATIGFGLRNLPDYLAGLREMARVVRPGGRIVVLEIAIPERGIPRLLFETWFRRIVPVLGRVAGRSSAYRYLPQSLLAYPAPAAVAALMEEVGLQRIRWRRLPSRMATLHVGERPVA